MKQSEFKKRRKQLMQRIGKGNIALIGSAAVRTRNRDVDYPFRQDSDFYYLTGFNEPESLAVFIPGREKGEYILFCREFDETKALWEGAHAGPYPPAGLHRHRLALRHPDLRGRQPNHPTGAGAEHLRRHRRRSYPRHEHIVLMYRIKQFHFLVLSAVLQKSAAIGCRAEKRGFSY